MEDNFYNDDGFEEFLQRQVKDHRLYPSDGIWRNIYKKLHGDTNWPALTIAAFTFLGIIIAFSFYFSPSPDIFSNYPADNLSSKHNENKTVVQKSAGDLVSNKVAARLNKGPIPYVNNGSEDGEEKTPEITASTNASAREVAIENNNIATPVFDGHPALSATPVNHEVLRHKPVPVYKKDNTVSSSIETLAPQELTLEAPFTSNAQTTVKANELSEGTIEKAEKISPKIYPESLLNTPGKNEQPELLKVKKSRANKFSYLVYITPSRSYRRLTQSNYFNKNTGPLALNYFVDVNKIARYNPGTGIEAGLNFMYNITDKLKVASGVQFNVRQYSLEAYIAPADMSTIALSNRSGSSADTITTYAVYRTSNGYLATELVNRYYEIALPIGLQWEIVGNRNVQLNVAASVQPTYLANKNAYLLSTDYKNYTVNSGLMHSWNVNTSLEAFITIKSGDFKWQLGPQFRYQNLPTFISKYPIRENLIDYGFKIGVSKNFK